MPTTGGHKAPPCMNYTNDGDWRQRMLPPPTATIKRWIIKSFNVFNSQNDPFEKFIDSIFREE